MRDLLLERAAVERGEEVARAAVGGARPAVGPLPGRLLPQPARRAARRCAARGVSARTASDGELRRPRPRRRPGRRGPGARAGRGAASTVAGTKTSDIDVVTEADRASEALIRGCVRGARPDDAFLGEEGDDAAGTSGVRWIVDPIDGTVNFLYGIPQYAVSIAAEVDGEVRGRGGARRRRPAPSTSPPRPTTASGRATATATPIAVRGRRAARRSG